MYLSIHEIMNRTLIACAVLFLILYLSGADCGGKCIGSSGGTGCGSFEGCSSGGGGC